VTGVKEKNGRVCAVEVNDGREIFAADYFISTLPINETIGCFGDKVPREVAAACDKFQYRDLLLVILFLDRPHVSECATIYFPDFDFPFTRIHEPKQRGPAMSPEGQTSLVVEIPLDSGDGLPGEAARRRLVDEASRKLVAAGLINADEIRDATTHEMRRAYPVLDLQAEKNMERADGFLQEIPNLISTGRNGRFAYAHIHDMLAMGKEAAAGIK